MREMLVSETFVSLLSLLLTVIKNKRLSCLLATFTSAFLKSKHIELIF